MKTEFLITEQKENNVEEHMFGFCNKCMTVYSHNNFGKYGCKSCKRHFFFKSNYKIVIFNIKSLILEFFQKNESCRNLKYLKKIESNLKKIYENNIFCNYEDENLCYYLKCNDKNLEKNIKTAWKIYWFFKTNYLKGKANKNPHDFFKTCFNDIFYEKEKTEVLCFPETQHLKVHNPAFLPNIYFSSIIIQKNFF